MFERAVKRRKGTVCREICCRTPALLLVCDIKAEKIKAMENNITTNTTNTSDTTTAMPAPTPSHVKGEHHHHWKFVGIDMQSESTTNLVAGGVLLGAIVITATVFCLVVVLCQKRRRRAKVEDSVDWAQEALIPAARTWDQPSQEKNSPYNWPSAPPQSHSSQPEFNPKAFSNF